MTSLTFYSPRFVETSGGIYKPYAIDHLRCQGKEKNRERERDGYVYRGIYVIQVHVYISEYVHKHVHHVEVIAAL